VSLERNSQCGVTGFLYHDADVFVQVLEGLRQDVDAVFASICRDRRHADLRTLSEERAESRLFGGWAMGLHGGGKEGFLLPSALRPDIASTAGAADAPALIRFLNDLSLGRQGAQIGPPG